MRVKKAGGRIFGGTMSAAEKKAMDLEIQRQLAEYDRKHLIEIDAMILWVLHERFGCGNTTTASGPAPTSWLSGTRWTLVMTCGSVHRC